MKGFLIEFKLLAFASKNYISRGNVYLINVIIESQLSSKYVDMGFWVYVY